MVKDDTRDFGLNDLPSWGFYIKIISSVLCYSESETLLVVSRGVFQEEIKCIDIKF